MPMFDAIYHTEREKYERKKEEEEEDVSDFEGRDEDCGAESYVVSTKF